MGLQVRLWLTVVVLVVAGGLVLLLGTSALYERVMLPFENTAGQSVNGVNGVLMKSAADTVEAVTRASVEEAVRAAVKNGELTPDAEAVLLARAAGQGAPSFALMVRPDGSVAARAGTDTKLTAIGGMPEVAEAITGVARDGVKVIDGKPFHLASAPVYDGADVAGVIVLGWPYDATYADRLAQQASAPVLLLFKGERLGDSLKAITNEQLRARGPGIGVGEIDIAPLPTFLPILIEHGRYTLTSVPLTFGASDEQMSAVVATDRNEAFRAMAWVQALVLGGTLILALLQTVLILITLRSVSKPIEVIVDHLSQVSQGNSVGILPEAALSGQFLRLGKQVNMILQLMPSMTRPGAPLGALSGPATGALSGSSPNIPAPNLPGIGAPSLGGAAIGASAAVAKDASGAALMNAGNGFDGLSAGRDGSGNMAGASEPSGLSGLFDDSAPDPLAAFRVAAPPSQPPARPPPPTPPPPQFDEPEPEPMHQEEPPVSAMSPEATVMFQVPQELIAQSANVGGTTGSHRAVTSQTGQAVPAPIGTNSALSAQSNHADDARTVVAQVPQELLSAAAPRDGMSNADEQHYRDVYDKFVETRVQCGEDTSDLTYDRFVAKLLKNRQQIIEKHKAKSVRFQVYVKEGKAALRALPVRE